MPCAPGAPPSARDDLDAARDRVLLGRRETSNALLPEERHAVAVHESGHALLAALCEHADPVAKVTILPSGMALGGTEQLPEAERHLYSESYLTDLLTVRLAGRAAELVVFGEGSTGPRTISAAPPRSRPAWSASSACQRKSARSATAPARRKFLGEPALDQIQRPYSEQTQRIVDEEVSRLLLEAENRAVDLLGAHRDALDSLAVLLVEHETIDGNVVLNVLREEATGQQPTPDAASLLPSAV